MNEAQPKAQTIYVLGAQWYVIGWVWLSGTGNPQNSDIRLGSLAQAVCK